MEIRNRNWKLEMAIGMAPTGHDILRTLHAIPGALFPQEIGKGNRNMKWTSGIEIGMASVGHRTMLIIGVLSHQFPHLVELLLVR